MRIPYPCARCLTIPAKCRCTLLYCSECSVFLDFFFRVQFVQMSFDDYLADKAKEREELL